MNDAIPSVKVKTLTNHSWGCTRCNFNNHKYFSVQGTGKCAGCGLVHKLIWVDGTAFDDGRIARLEKIWIDTVSDGDRLRYALRLDWDNDWHQAIHLDSLEIEDVEYCLAQASRSLKKLNGEANS